MKKLTVLVLVLLSFTLTGCEKSEEEYVFEQPEDQPVVLQNLPYSDYLSLKNPVITIKVKDVGEMKLQLFPEIAPNTVNSMILYIQDGKYDGSTFHRVIEDFMIQGGKITGVECALPGEMTIKNEDNDLGHFRGVISMARVGTDLDSATSQFFIVDAYASHLDTQYTAFGGLVDGFEILDYIASLQDGDTEEPVTTIVIESITVELNGYTTEDRVCAE